MRRHYCCYFDHRYLPRGLVMIQSLRAHDPGAVVWVLCLDDLCKELLAASGERDLQLLRLADLERGDAALLDARSNRSLIEYYFTCTPSLVRYVLARVSPGDCVTYVDGDLCFFAAPEPLYAELGSGSVSIVPHRFTPKVRHLERFGRYNVGWLTFRNEAAGVAVADWWRERCNEWCYDVLDDDRFADQKYLESFERLFPGVIALRNPGANLAPWNLGGHALSVRDGGVLVDGVPLVFFHFHGLRTLGRSLYLTDHRRYGAPFAGLVRRHIYRPYVQQLAGIAAQVERLQARSANPLARMSSRRSAALNRLLGGFKRPAKNALSLALGEFVLVVNGRAL
jgi:hypothetical protein